MTDLKDSSLSLLLQITSSDMFGHADNVLNENSFQGWMGYKLSTPRVGYFFNCCFILLGERQQGGGTRKSQAESFTRPGLGFAEDDEGPQMKAFGSVSAERLFCLFCSLSVGVREMSTKLKVCHCWHRRGRASGAFTSATATGSTSAVWAVCLEEVPGRCICSVSSCRLSQALCVHSVLWVGNHWAERVLLLCISSRSIGLNRYTHSNCSFFFQSLWINYHFPSRPLQAEIIY